MSIFVNHRAIILVGWFTAVFIPDGVAIEKYEVLVNWKIFSTDCIVIFTSVINKIAQVSHEYSFEHFGVIITVWRTIFYKNSISEM